jgi:hypothetical protein
MRFAALILATLLVTATPAAAGTIAYWGPVSGTIADPALDCAPGDPNCGTIVYADANWLTPAPSTHCPTCQQYHAVTVCELAVNTYGPSIGNQRVEVPALLVWNALYPAYHAACPQCYQFGSGDRQVCSVLLHVGQCIKLAGHENDAPDILGQTWIADSIAPCS